MGGTKEQKVNLDNLIKAVDVYNAEIERARLEWVTQRGSGKFNLSNPVLETIIDVLKEINKNYEPSDFIIFGISRLRAFGIIDDFGQYDIILEGLKAYNVDRDSSQFINSCLFDFERRKDFINNYVTKEGYKRTDQKIGNYRRDIDNDLKVFSTGEQASILARLRFIFDNEINRLREIESLYKRDESQVDITSLFHDGNFIPDPSRLNEFFWRNQSVDRSSTMVDHFLNLTRYGEGLMHISVLRDLIRQHSGPIGVTGLQSETNKETPDIKSDPIAKRLNEYGFHELEKVKIHGDSDKLLSLIIDAPKHYGLKRKNDKALGYRMAMIWVLGFDEHIYHNHAKKSRQETFSILAQIFDADARTIKGHLNSLNPRSTDREIYKAYIFIEQATKDYKIK